MRSLGGSGCWTPRTTAARWRRASRARSSTGCSAVRWATLHRHFKTATGMSPMRFQKHLRLHEARRQLIVGNTTAVLVAEAVGYGSATQFNREYRSFYGLPPAQDAARLRERMASTRS
nr:AraC family transcriptional regulator [Amycolatopsis sp.]